VRSRAERDDNARVIRIEGAREHNLKSVSLSLPRDRLIVITGVSGSGKSSLAFDTIYAEGQRRYMESLSAYARQFLDQMQKPDIDRIEGLPPTIAIEQRAASSNPRSTVATTTEIYDYLRVLFARAGTPHCHRCGRPIERQTATQIVDRISELPAQTRVMILAPVVRGQKGHHREIFRMFQSNGFVRARVDGVMIDLADPPQLHRYRRHTVEAVVDRVVAGKVSRSRLQESVEMALRVSSGLVIASRHLPVQQAGEGNGWSDELFSEHYACVPCGTSLEELSPRMFSFNSPYGACPTCDGLGTRLEFDPDLIVPDRTRSLREGAIQGWRRGGRRMNIYYSRLLRRFAERHGIDLEMPYAQILAPVQKGLLFGDGGFEGVIPNLERRFRNTESEYVKARLHRFMSELSCPSCQGARLKPEALAVRVGEKNIREVTSLPVHEARFFFEGLLFDPEREKVARPLLREIGSRLRFLEDVGLEYLTLDRQRGTLSGGEAQRIRLGTQVGAGLVGVCYVLDEPTIGLHMRDNERLIRTLQKLRDLGNTVVVVEHDEETIASADWVVDLGPGAGEGGGRLVAQGSVERIRESSDSLTGKYLKGVLSIPVPPRRRPTGPKTAWIRVRGAREHNLQNIDVGFPTGCFICVTGVSGSGKSTLVSEILYKGAMRALGQAREKPGRHRSIDGLEAIDKVIAIDQSPIGRTPRSNAATYTGALDIIRPLFAETTEAKVRGYGPSRFSFNVKGGRCEACEGQGTKCIEMHFLPDVYVTCAACQGTRYNRETLEVRCLGRTIHEVLRMPVVEAVAFFQNVPKLKRILRTLLDVGLGYLPLGQASTTLSGGEAQRIKLSAELARQDTGRTLYIMDEPTIGLHFADVGNLLEVIKRLADAGNTFVVIEHHLDVIKTADYLVDLGPEGGADGGRVVAFGTPEEVASCTSSHTGRYLRGVFGGAVDRRARSAV
jgi:excinuclease ABC subunit A